METMACLRAFGNEAGLAWTASGSKAANVDVASAQPVAALMDQVLRQKT